MTAPKTWDCREGFAPHYHSQISCEATGKTIAVAYSDETGENGRLLSAAPDLMAACNALLRCYDYGQSTTAQELAAAANAARTAIAKAKGGAK